MNDKKCLNCGKEVSQTEGKRPRLFCKEEKGKVSCRTAYWKKNVGSAEKIIFENEDIVCTETSKGEGKISPKTEKGKSAIKKFADFWSQTTDTKEEKVAELPIPTDAKTLTDQPKPPTTLDELKALCPKELTGFEKSQWVATERQKYGI